MEEIHRTIIQVYERSAYKFIGQTLSGLKFSNTFSLHYVFVLQDVTELLQTWQHLHEEVVLDYLNSQIESFIEWNFYCIYVLHHIDEGQRSAIEEIEQDRSYSRKFVRLVSELDMLPPGRMLLKELEEMGEIGQDIAASWKATLGGKLYRIVMSDPKRNIKSRLLKLVEESDE